MGDYKSLNKMNQSLLKQILKHPQSFLSTQKKYNQEQEDKANGVAVVTPPAFVFGAAVDHMLTEDIPFEDVFYVMDSNKKPSETMMAIVNTVFNEYKSNGNLIDHQVAILEVCARLDYQSRWKPDTKCAKVVEDGSAYFKVLQESANMTILSKEEYDLAVIATAALKSDEYTGYFLKASKTVEIIKKPIFEFEFQGVEFKGEGDLITIDHKIKTIFPLDIKTIGGDVMMFQSNFWKFRYDFQAAFYTKGCESHPQVKKLLGEGYKLAPFKFLVVEKDCVKRPMVYSVPHEVLKIGQLGGTLSNGKLTEGIVSAVKRYKYHMENNKWEYPMEYYLNGEMCLEI